MSWTLTLPTFIKKEHGRSSIPCTSGNSLILSFAILTIGQIFNIFAVLKMFHKINRWTAISGMKFSIIFLIV